MIQWIKQLWGRWFGKEDAAPQETCVEFVEDEALVEGVAAAMGELGVAEVTDSIKAFDPTPFKHKQGPYRPETRARLRKRARRRAVRESRRRNRK